MKRTFLPVLLPLVSVLMTCCSWCFVMSLNVSANLSAFWVVSSLATFLLAPTAESCAYLIRSSMVPLCGLYHLIPRLFSYHLFAQSTSACCDPVKNCLYWLAPIPALIALFLACCCSLKARVALSESFFSVRRLRTLLSPSCAAISLFSFNMSRRCPSSSMYFLMMSGYL